MEILRFCFGLSCTAAVITAIVAGAAMGILAFMVTMAVSGAAGLIWSFVKR